VIASLVLVIAAAAGGVALASLLHDDEPLWMRLPAAMILGLVVLGLGGFFAANVAGALGGVAVLVAVAAVLALVPLLWLRRGAPAGASRPWSRPWTAARGLTAAWVLGLAALLVRLYDRAAYFASDGRFATGVDHNIGDLPFHVAIVTSFLYGDNFPPEHPELAGTRLTYPVLADFLTALLMKAGATLGGAMLLQNVVLALAVLGLLHRWAAALTGDRAAALIAPVLVLFSGGLGFLRLLDDVDPTRGGLAGHLTRLTHDYTIVGSGELRWGNVIVTMLIPQRSFLMGLPLFLVAWTAWWQATAEGAPPERRVRLMTGAGLAVGLMPLAHVHAFLVAMGMAACLALLFPDRRTWLRFFAVAAAVAAPQLLWLAWGSGLQAAEFLDWHVGWDHGGRNPLAFWLMNLGLYLPAGVLALLWRGRTPVVAPRLARFTLPFVLCLLVPNVVRLSPWIWDNIKFLIWWHLAWAPPVALLLVGLWRRGRGARILSVAAGLVMVLSGALDVWRVASGQIEHTIFTAEGVVFAERVKGATPPRAIVLHAPTYNSEVYLTGRRSVLGYPGHIWSQGLDAGTREQDVKGIYEGTGHPGQLARYGVDAVLVGPLERGWAQVDEYALGSCPAAAAEGSYVLLRCRR
jgi:hypothetical protein